MQRSGSMTENDHSYFKACFRRLMLSISSSILQTKQDYHYHYYWYTYRYVMYTRYLPIDSADAYVCISARLFGQAPALAVGPRAIHNSTIDRYRHYPYPVLPIRIKGNAVCCLVAIEINRFFLFIATQLHTHSAYPSHHPPLPESTSNRSKLPLI